MCHEFDWPSGRHRLYLMLATGYNTRCTVRPAAAGATAAAPAGSGRQYNNDNNNNIGCSQRVTRGGGNRAGLCYRTGVRECGPHCACAQHRLCYSFTFLTDNDFQAATCANRVGAQNTIGNNKTTRSRLSLFITDTFIIINIVLYIYISIHCISVLSLPSYYSLDQLA